MYKDIQGVEGCTVEYTGYTRVYRVYYLEYKGYTRYTGCTRVYRVYYTRVKTGCTRMLLSSAIAGQYMEAYMRY